MKDRISNWAVVPAAGVGRRMEADIPKQYLSVHGKSILEHTVNRLLSHPKIDGVVVAIADDDKMWSSMSFESDKLIITAPGGEERCDSVINALNKLAELERSDEQDWVLVHDAARPCLRLEDIDALFDQLSQHMVGGLLAYPVRDTMKRCDDKQRSIETVNRKELWHAMTPQMFRFYLLRDAINKALRDDVKLTDESSAVEYAGYKPKLVEGHTDNIKVTTSSDLVLAELVLKQQEAVSMEYKR